MSVRVVRNPATDALLRRVGRFVVFASLWTACGAAVSGADADGGWQQQTTVRSGSGRFFISADDAVERMRLSRWADDVYFRLQKVWHPAAVLPEDTVFDIIVDSEGKGRLPGAIESRRFFRGDRVNLGLRIESVAALDGEQFIEAVSAMILDALIIAAQPEDDRRFYEETIPQWLSVGVAQGLYPALRIRNQKLVVDLWRNGMLPDGNEVLAWRHLSPYRGFEHAVSGVWVAWATGHWMQPSHALQSWITLRAQGWPITAERLKPPRSASRAPADGWEPYVAAMQRLFTAGDGISAADRYGRLRQALQAAPGVSGIPGTVELSADDALDALIPLRREPWIESFVRSRSNELSALAAGGAAEYRELVERLTEFLNALESRRLRFLLRRDYRRILNEIDEQEQLAVLREQYVSLFELRHRPDPLPAWLADDGLDAPPPSRMRRYVNGFDTP